MNPETPCNRCGEVVARDEGETCWRCGKTICTPCWRIGHCVHEEPGPIIEGDIVVRNRAVARGVEHAV